MDKVCWDKMNGKAEQGISELDEPFSLCPLEKETEEKAEVWKEWKRKKDEEAKGKFVGKSERGRMGGESHDGIEKEK